MSSITANQADFSDLIAEVEDEINTNESPESFAANISALVCQRITDDQFQLLKAQVSQFTHLFSKDHAASYQALVLDYNEFERVRLTVGLVHQSSGQQQIKTTISRLLNQFSISAVNFVPLDHFQFQVLFNEAYLSRAIEKKQGHQEKERTRRTISGSSTLSADENRKQTIEELAGQVIDLTDLKTYEKTMAGLENGSLTYANLDARQLVVTILQDFIISGCSDVHFQASDQFGGVVRYRVTKGEMFTRFDNIPLYIAKLIINSLCIFGNGSPSDMFRENVESKIRMKINYGGEIKNVTFRFQSLYSSPIPTVVLRAQVEPIRDINILGIYADQLHPFLAACRQERGVVIVTGPTGSGKTNTLESVMADREADYKLNIVEVGDPCEIVAPRRVQLTIPRHGRSKDIRYEEAFTACMRADPDIVYFTELRAANVAEVVLRTAITGHAVFSTMHAADVEETLVRLFNMGIDRDNMAKGLRAICAQKLVKKLCPVCRLDDHQASLVAGSRIYRENIAGCNNCSAGFAGRTAICEILVFDDDISKWIMEGKKPSEIKNLALEMKKFQPLRQIALRKVTDGLTSETQVAQILSRKNEAGNNLQSMDTVLEGYPGQTTDEFLEDNYTEGEFVDLDNQVFDENGNDLLQIN